MGWVGYLGGGRGRWGQESEVGGESLGSLEGGDVEVREQVAYAWRGAGGGESVGEGGFEGGIDRKDVGYAVGVEVRGERVRREREGQEREDEAIEGCVEGSGEWSAWFPRDMSYVECTWWRR